MKKSRFIVLLLLFCLQPGFLAAQRAEAIRKDVLNPRLDKVLVVAHRGNWSIAPENSLAAIDSARTTCRRSPARLSYGKAR